MSGDKQLIWRIRHGSRKAADVLFEKYYKEIYAYIYRQCAERELAKDLTQDTFVAVFRGLSITCLIVSLSTRPFSTSVSSPMEKPASSSGCSYNRW